MKFVDYYKVLGIKKTASLQQIRKSYLLKAKEHHPDRGGQEERMNRVNEAYETLKDPRTRALYDELHRARYSPAPDESIFFTEMFSDHKTKKQLSSEALTGIRKYAALTFLVVVLVLSIYIYAKSDIYLVLLPILTISVIRFSRYLYDWLAVRANPKKFIYRTSFLFSAYCVLIVITALVTYFVSSHYRYKLSNNQPVSSVLSDEDLINIKTARSEYENCQNEFNTISTQLQLANQQIDKSVNSGDLTTYNRTKATREKLVADFSAQQSKCTMLQNSYNELLEKYRVNNGDNQ